MLHHPRYRHNWGRFVCPFYHVSITSHTFDRPSWRKHAHNTEQNWSVSSNVPLLPWYSSTSLQALCKAYERGKWLHAPCRSQVLIHRQGPLLKHKMISRRICSILKSKEPRIWPSLASYSSTMPTTWMSFHQLKDQNKRKEKTHLTESKLL